MGKVRRFEGRRNSMPPISPDRGHRFAVSSVSRTPRGRSCLRTGPSVFALRNLFGFALQGLFVFAPYGPSSFAADGPLHQASGCRENMVRRQAPPPCRIAFWQMKRVPATMLDHAGQRGGSIGLAEHVERHCLRCRYRRTSPFALPMSLNSPVRVADTAERHRLRCRCC